MRTEDIQAALYAFLLAAFGGETGSDADPAWDDAARLLAAHRTLRADTVAIWPPATKQAVREILGAWLIVLEIDRRTEPGAPWPGDFLAGTTTTRLGEPALAYIQEKLPDLVLIARRERQARQDRGPE